MNDTSNTDLDARVDEILEQLGLWYNGQFEYGKITLTPKRAKQALTKLIADREREARIDELDRSHGSPMVAYKTGHSWEFVKGWNAHRSEVMKRLAKLRKEGDK